MAKLKTQPTEISVEAFLRGIEDDTKRKDARAILKMMKEVTGEKPKMWGPGIIGFGNYHYKYESGREGDWFLTGFSPRKTNFSLYLMEGFGKYEELMEKLGKYKTGKSCLYIKRLADVDTNVLRQLIKGSAEYVAKQHKR